MIKAFSLLPNHHAKIRSATERIYYFWVKKIIKSLKLKNKNRKAIIVLPAAMAGRISVTEDRRWLSRSKLCISDSPREIFARVLSAVGLPPIEEGLAALRLWGQTGDRPNAWLAAAEPVHMEIKLDHLCLHALRGAQSFESNFRVTFDSLQKLIVDDTTFSFVRVGNYGYLRGNTAIATASLSSAVIDGLQPDEFMPCGESAAGYHKLLGEIQMRLHECKVDFWHEVLGLVPVNSVWFWGDGKAPQKKVQKLPTLFGDDPLFKGYWQSCTGVIVPWPQNFEQCLDMTTEDFVVVTPASDRGGDLLTAYFVELRELLKTGRLNKLILLFRDGLTAEVDRFDSFRFWRRLSELL